MPEQLELQRKTGRRGLLTPATRGLKKDSDSPAAEAVPVPAHLALTGSPQPKQLRHLHVQPSLGQSCCRQKSVLHLCTQGRFSHVQLCNPVDCGLPGFFVRGFSRQEYWSVLTNTGCHTLLEHYISCCPTLQLP